MNRIKIVMVIFLQFLFLQIHLQGQSINVAGIFPTIDHSGSLSKKLDYSLYYFAAFPLDNLDKANQLKESYFHLFYAEQALSFKPSEKITFTGSYVYQRENVVYPGYINENRFYLQFKHKHAIKKTALQHRFRFDGRFVQNRTSGKSPFTHRIRYLIGAEIPFSERSYLSLYQEAFFNTSTTPSFKYAENWAYLAWGRKINEVHKIEAGLLYVTWNLQKNNWFNQYYFQFTWISHLNFDKEKK